MNGRAMRRGATNRRLPVRLGSCYAFTGTTAREGGARSSETPIRRLNLKHMLPQTWSKRGEVLCNVLEKGRWILDQPRFANNPDWRPNKGADATEKVPLEDFTSRSGSRVAVGDPLGLFRNRDSSRPALPILFDVSELGDTESFIRIKSIFPRYDLGRSPKCFRTSGTAEVFSHLSRAEGAGLRTRRYLCTPPLSSGENPVVGPQGKARPVGRHFTTKFNQVWPNSACRPPPQVVWV